MVDKAGCPDAIMGESHCIRILYFRSHRFSSSRTPASGSAVDDEKASHSTNRRRGPSDPHLAATVLVGPGPRGAAIDPLRSPVPRTSGDQARWDDDWNGCGDTMAMIDEKTTFWSTGRDLGPPIEGPKKRKNKDAKRGGHRRV